MSARPSRTAREARRIPAGARWRRWHPFGSLRNRLAGIFFLIALAAIGVVYLFVAPTIGARLQSQLLNRLKLAAQDNASYLADNLATTNQRDLHELVQSVSSFTGYRVTLLGVSGDENAGLQVYPKADNTTTSTADIYDASGPDFQKIGSRAARRDGLQTAIEDTASQGLLALVAYPLRPASARARVPTGVVILSSSLSDVKSSVGLIRTRILIAAAIGLSIAVITGYLVAHVLTLRVKRLERAARRVASGDFTAYIPTSSPDELGRLARALDDMQRQLAELDSARKRFIATASHELRTPIFSLGGFLELLLDEDLDEETRRDFTEHLRSQVDRLGRLATGLLDLSRLESGSLELSIADEDLGPIAQGVTSEFLPALAAHDSPLRLQLDSRPLHARCDRERVAQILRILIDNAIIHTPPGTTITVTSSRVGGEACLAVIDSAGGLQGQQLERLFEPFYTSGGVQRSGLGLAIARELAERMRGRLEVKASAAATLFLLYMPLVQPIRPAHSRGTREHI